jgi:hypothetical protein
MGYQLWTSPVTGRRRRGTRLAELRSLLGAGITARAILEPLRSCPADARADDMALILEGRDFDVAGVQDVRNGPVIGFVERARLQGGPVRDHRQDLTADHLISDATPLSTLLATLSGRQRAFVLVGTDVRGIVTQADLNKPPVRVYLFGLVSLLEMHLEFWVRAEYPDDSWQAALKTARLKKAKRVQVDRHARNQDVSLLECLEFSDKRDLIVQRPQLRETLGLSDPDWATDLLERARRLRNDLAHSQLDLGRGSSWPEVIKLVQSVEELA